MGKIKKTLSLKQKYEISQLKGKTIFSVKSLQQQYDCGKTQIYDIFKAAESIKNEFLALERAPSSKRKEKQSEFSEINRRLIDWFRLARSKNIPISGSLLQEKAKTIAVNLNISEFHASNGWLESFRKKNGIKFGQICGEAASVCQETIENWKNRISIKIEGYEAKDIANGDETALFFVLYHIKLWLLKMKNVSVVSIPKSESHYFFVLLLMENLRNL